MDIIGIVCEYNPFHLGHLYHIRESRRQLGGDPAVVCVMSGDFVQRGDAAVYSKFARAEAACRCGADLVVELPLPWCLSSAEGFARGAVQLLSGLGATYLSFGSESGDLAPLSLLAETLLEPEFIEETKRLIASEPSLSFAAARQRAAEARLGGIADLLSQANDILAVEYLKAIYSLGLNIRPLAVKRLGAGHDADEEVPGPRSASQLRTVLAQGGSIDEYVPSPAAAVFRRERERGRQVSSPELLETALLSRLRMFDREYFLSLPDCADGLGDRLYRAVRSQSTLDDICQAAKTKRYALSRIRRACLCACLGVTADMSKDAPPYARVLAAGPKGREILRRQSGSGAVPLLTKPAAVKGMSDACREIFSLGAAAHDLFVLGCPSLSARSCGQDWRARPFII